VSDSDPAAATGSPISEATGAALELPDLLALVAELAATDAGRERVLELVPATSVAALEGERRRFEEAGRALEDGPLVPSFEGPLAPLVERLAGGGRDVAGSDLLEIAGLLRATRQAIEALAAAEPPCSELSALADRLEDLRPLARRISKTLDRRGRVRDDASSRLSELGRAARRTRDELYRDLRGYIERHRDLVAEETTPLHGGRLVLLLAAGSGGRSKGLIHGRSATGKSRYFEPFETVDANNRLQETRQEEEEERDRLLAELVTAAAESAAAVAGHLDFMAELDRHQAAHRFGAACDGRLAEIAPRHELRLASARHPLLDPRLADLRERALGNRGHTGVIEPLDIQLEAGRRVLAITGPNAGGKTVALKTVGLLALASQCALPVPVGPGSRLPVFARVVATVGDEQDLLEDRSTFSGRLMRLREAWEAAGPDALLLLDELGSGTDPEEGAALGIALVEGLVARRALALITTPLTRVSAAALEFEGAACAAMEFDSQTGTPTYRLEPGAPGGSEALALARRLELPAEWLDRAEALLGPEHRKLQVLLQEVEKLRRELADEATLARRETRRLEEERAALERTREDLDAARAAAATAARKELREFRRKVKVELREEVERVRAEARSGRKRGVADKAAERLFAEAPAWSQPEEEEAGDVVVGASVEHGGLGWRGVVERLSGSSAEVRVEGKRVRCRPGDLRPISGPPPGKGAPRRAQRRRRVEGLGEETAAVVELNLVGQRVEPALEALDSFLDRALLEDRSRIRIVHGHGTGRLRDAVREHLRRHPAVGDYRAGGKGEGGDGATVVALKE
jgi:DNA mismatch repair protein MutS2